MSIKPNEPIHQVSSWDRVDDVPSTAIAEDQRRGDGLHTSESTPVDSSDNRDGSYTGVYLTQSISPNGRHSRTRLHFAKNKVRYSLLLAIVMGVIGTYFGVSS